jgi:2-C-methyl-D-erythritol 4-phosphate cytidylyltransferase/2-C-methyl-D-erythritol 2,4-cyclodiphosphate synthase
MNKVGAIIVAAGRSQRMGSINKIFALLGGKPLLAWSVDVCQKSDLVQQIVVVLDDATLERGEKLRESRGWCKVTICLGGPRRQDSVAEGLHVLEDCDWVVVHDGARPFLTPDSIETGLRTAVETGAAITAVPVKDAIKLTDDERLIAETLRRDRLWAAQTPQVFRFDIIKQAYTGLTAELTDDAAAVERLGYKIKIYRGSYDNIKVTTPEDLKVAEVIAQEKRDMRVGTGYDAHPLVPGRRLILGGVELPSDKGPLGHSDADVAAHAVIDALLGAASLGDIGTLFPPEESGYEDVSSLALLSQVGDLLRREGFGIANIDVTIMAASPRLSPFIEEMRRRVSQALGIDIAQVAIKASSNNGLGFVGREEGIAAQSVALVQKGRSQKWDF